MIYRSPGSTSLAVAPTLKQSGEFVRRLRGFLLKAGHKLRVGNTFGLELENGSRCLAMPGQDDASLRGFTIDAGDLVIDEAARVDDPIYDAVRPMLIRYANTNRLIILSTAWAKQGFFYRIWTEGDASWLKFEARVEECRHITAETIERERRDLGAKVFAREYRNIFDSLEQRFFDLDAIDGAFGPSVSPSPPTSATPEEDPVMHRTPAFRHQGAFA